MAEIEKTPDLITGDDIGSNVIDHTIVSPSFINVSGSDPTVANDTGQGYVVGSIWVNSTSGEVFQAIDVTAESSVWVNQEGDDVNNDPYNGTNYGFSIGGYGPTGGGDVKDVIEKFSLTSPHAMSDYGEVTTAAYEFGSFTDAAKSKGFICGGYTAPDSLSEVTTFNFTGSPIASTDIGEVLNQNAAGFALQCQTPSVGILGGGIHYASGDVIIDNIQTLSNGSSPFTAADVAEMATTIRDSSCSESPTHGYAGGGYGPGYLNNIQRYQKATTDNAADVGELSIANASQGGGGATDGRGGFGFHITGQNTSGTEIDTIQKFPFSSPTTSSDVGEFTPSSSNLTGHQCSSTTHFFSLDYTANLWKGAYASPSTTSDVAEATTDHDNNTMTQY